jgi:hypothetical protein
LLLSVLLGCGIDRDSPEGAVRALEEAYIRKDLEAAVALRDFRTEAVLSWQSLKPELAEDQQVIRETAEVLELSFRKEIATQGFPDFASLKCRFTNRQVVAQDLVKVTEECVFPDGGKSIEDIHVVKGETGWRVVIVPN